MANPHAQSLARDSRGLVGNLLSPRRKTLREAPARIRPLPPHYYFWRDVDEAEARLFRRAGIERRRGLRAKRRPRREQERDRARHGPGPVGAARLVRQADPHGHAEARRRRQPHWPYEPLFRSTDDGR